MKVIVLERIFPTDPNVYILKNARKVRKAPEAGMGFLWPKAVRQGEIEDSARLQDAPYLRKIFSRISNVLENAYGERGVEIPVGKRQRAPVIKEKTGRDAVGSRVARGNGNKIFLDINAGHLGARFSKRNGNASVSRSDVKHAEVFRITDANTEIFHDPARASDLVRPVRNDFLPLSLRGAREASRNIFARNDMNIVKK